MKGYYPQRIKELNDSLLAMIQKTGELRKQNKKLQAQLERSRKALKRLKDTK